VLIRIFILTFLGTLLTELAMEGHALMREALAEEDQDRPR